MERPQLFLNPPNAAYEILFDRQAQDQVADESAARLRTAGKPEEYGDIGVIYEDSFVIALRDAVRFRDGHLGPYVRLIGAEAGSGAAVLPLTSDGRVLIVRHFRHGLRSWQWEIPRGFADPGADGAATAARELEEEVGVTVDKVELLGKLSGDDGTDEIYLAQLNADALPEKAPAGAVEEGIDERCLVTWDELSDMVADGKIGDQYLLAAFAFMTARGKR